MVELRGLEPRTEAVETGADLRWMFIYVVARLLGVLLICVAVLRDATSLERSDRSVAYHRPVTCGRYAHDNRLPVIGTLWPSPPDGRPESSATSSDLSDQVEFASGAIRSGSGPVGCAPRRWSARRRIGAVATTCDNDYNNAPPAT